MAQVNQSNLFQFNAGILNKDACVVIVRTEWNQVIVGELEKGCIRTLEAAGLHNHPVITVPGAVEIPFAIRRYYETQTGDKTPHAFIALGCVLRGDTPHFEYVCNTVTDGITQLNLRLPVPVIFGVLTVNTQEQADERIGGKHGHKGEEAALTAMKMMALNDQLKKA